MDKKRVVKGMSFIFASIFLLLACTQFDERLIAANDIALEDTGKSFLANGYTKDDSYISTTKEGSIEWKGFKEKRDLKNGDGRPGDKIINVMVVSPLNLIGTDPIGDNLTNPGGPIVDLTSVEAGANSSEVTIKINLSTLSTTDLQKKSCRICPDRYRSKSIYRQAC